jgi:AcrR family transcriptional regulator
MARPVQADAAATRHRLVETAVAHFSRSGSEATSLRRIAEEAGVSLATIHYYFGGKARLYEACMESLHGTLAAGFAPMQKMFTGIIERVAGAEVDLDSLHTLLDGLVRTSFRFARQHPGLLRLIMRPLIEEGELDARWREGSLVPFLDAAARGLARATGWPVAEQRFGVQTVIAVGMRYALSSPRELAQLNGLDPGREDEAVATTEDRLVRLAQRVLLEQAPRETGG